MSKLKKAISSDSNLIIETKNVNYQISSLKIQKNNNNPNISSIDLGICEEILKRQEGLSKEDNLIIFKIDIKNADLSKTYILYEIYNPITLNRINMEACENNPIGISFPVNLDENTKNIYYSLNQSGYNLFDLNDPFYNDICSTYTTKYRTDLSLIDRKILIYDKNGNISICQNGCTFKFYNLTNGKAKCVCDVQIEEIITYIEQFKYNSTQIVNSFYKTLKNSNFLLLKCYKLVFSKKGQKNNIGSYLLSAITFIIIILIFIYMLNETKKLDSIIQSILDFKLNYKNFHQINDIKKFEKRNTENNIKKKKNSKKKSTLLKLSGKTNFIESSKCPPKKINFGLDFRKSIPSFNGFINSLNKSQSSSNRKITEILDKQQIKKIEKIENKSIENKEEYLDKYKIKELNDEELNNLDYEDALVMDKRTFFNIISHY